MTDVDLADPPFAVPPRQDARRVEIELAGEPRGKGRPRFIRKTGFAYTPASTVSYENALAHEAAMVMAGAKPIESAVRVRVEAFFSVPSSYSKTRRAACLLNAELPAKKPDCDNIVKMLDALNGIVWVDDRQIVKIEIAKFYHERPRLRVVVHSL